MTEIDPLQDHAIVHPESLTDTEMRRLFALWQLSVLDTDPEPRFDDLTKVVSKSLNVPTALISLVDLDRQWFKSCVGLSATETPRSMAFCSRALHEKEVLVIPDATLDDRFKDNELVVEKRRESEQRFRDLAEVSSDWFWETDASHRLTYLSDRFYQLTGYRPNQCIGFAAEKFAAGAVDGPRWTRQREALAARRPFREFVSDLDAADGRRLTVSVNGLPQFDAAGAFTGYRGTASDITLRRIAEEARDEALQRAEYANQAKSEFLATMSHEFRTPLNAIIGFSELMRTRVFGPLGSDTYDTYAEAIHSSGNHMLTLVNDVLDISAIETGHRAYRMEAVDTEDVVRGCLAEVAAIAADHDVSLGFDGAPGLPRCFADRRSVRQIVTNLLSNAIKYNKVGGEVRVALTALDNGIEIKFTDTGIGIPADRMGAILEPFIQADNDPLRTSDGAGLGLSIVRSLVDAHRGTLTFESEVGQGTTVRVTLPLAEKEAAAE
jgi:PAS domain S-box-containing protein